MVGFLICFLVELNLLLIVNIGFRMNRNKFKILNILIDLEENLIQANSS